MDFLPGGEVAVPHLAGHQAVGDDGVGDVAVEVEVGEGSLRFLDDHFLRVEHQPHRRLLGIGQQGFHTIQLQDQFLHSIEKIIVGDGKVHHGAQDGPGQLYRFLLNREDLLQVPTGYIGHGQQLQGRSCGRTIHDDDLVIAVVVQMHNLQEAGDLFHAREDGHLFGDDVVQPPPLQHRSHVALHVAPVLLHLV